MDSETRLTEGSLDRELDEIILEIDAPFGELPVEAIRAAQRHRAQIVSRLVQLIERAVQDVKDGGKLETNGHFFALFLLIESGIGRVRAVGFANGTGAVGGWRASQPRRNRISPQGDFDRGYRKRRL
jgi:hypothetical protein